MSKVGIMEKKPKKGLSEAQLKALEEGRKKGREALKKINKKRSREKRTKK